MVCVAVQVQAQRWMETYAELAYSATACKTQSQGCAAAGEQEASTLIGPLLHTRADAVRSQHYADPSPLSGLL